MPRRVPLDPHLAESAFRVADALAAGVGAGRLRGPDLARPHSGVRIARAAPRSPARDYVPLLRPGDRFSGPTAAELWGAPLPSGLPLHVTAGSGHTRPRRPGVVGHNGPDAVSASRAGLPISPPALTFLECAGVLELADLVAVGDHLVLDPRVLDPHDLRPYVDLGDLREFLAAARGRHVRLARRAAELVRVGAESRRETLLRLLILEAGLPEPECGMLIRDEAGRDIGYFDLVWPERRVIAEYDGDQHRTSTLQYDRDIRRFDRATDAGYRVIRVRARGLSADRAETVSRLRRALAR